MEKNYDLEERTARFSENLIKFIKKIPKSTENIPMITQLTKPGTSVGANYYEATEAESKKDFSHKIGIAKKEAKETKYWFRIIAASEPNLKNDSRELWKEAQELNLIFGKIRRSCNGKN
ncbi:MAG: four helix bundle protein [bacterium]|nr:four helix bundle protein [bacterium]